VPSVLVAGSGGQGILFIGKLLAQAAMQEGKNVTWFPSYGAEMRGGTANCTVVISEETIGSPVVRNPDILIVLNTPSLERFQERLKPGGTLVLDTSLVKGNIRDDIRVIGVPATEVAVSLGSPRAANMVVLGAVIGGTGIVSESQTIDALRELTPAKRQKSLNPNIKAIKEGIILGDKKS